MLFLSAFIMLHLQKSADHYASAKTAFKKIWNKLPPRVKSLMLILVSFIFKIDSFTIAIFRTQVPKVSIVFEHWQRKYTFDIDYKWNLMRCLIS